MENSNFADFKIELENGELKSVVLTARFSIVQPSNGSEGFTYFSNHNFVQTQELIMYLDKLIPSRQGEFAVSYQDPTGKFNLMHAKAYETVAMTVQRYVGQTSQQISFEVLGFLIKEVQPQSMLAREAESLSRLGKDKTIHDGHSTMIFVGGVITILLLAVIIILVIVSNFIQL